MAFKITPCKALHCTNQSPHTAPRLTEYEEKDKEGGSSWCAQRQPKPGPIRVESTSPSQHFLSPHAELICNPPWICMQGSPWAECLGRILLDHSAHSAWYKPAQTHHIHILTHEAQVLHINQLKLPLSMSQITDFKFRGQRHDLLIQFEPQARPTRGSVHVFTARAPTSSWFLWLPLRWLLQKTWRTTWQLYTNTAGEESLFLLATLKDTSHILLLSCYQLLVTGPGCRVRALSILTPRALRSSCFCCTWRTGEIRKQRKREKRNTI